MSAEVVLNRAFVFIKPHAVFPEVEALVRETLEKRWNITIESSGKLAVEDIDRCIDRHYGVLALRAMSVDPAELPWTGRDAEFRSMFGEDRAEVYAAGRLLNLKQVQLHAQFKGLTPSAIEALWRQRPAMKIAAGTYVAKLDGSDIYCINGFYGSMREKFTSAEKAPNGIIWMICSWPETQLSWADFREKAIGATDPSKAVALSLRNVLLSQWKSLGLGSSPNSGDNGVHASASPVEGIAERHIWLDQDLASDALGVAFTSAGVPISVLEKWIQNPTVTLEGRGEGKVFDLVEGLDTSSVVKLAAASIPEGEGRSSL